MGCYCPLTAYRLRDGGITFTRSASLSGEKFDVPCGRCIGCRLEKSRQWAMRCVHEAKLHQHNSFVTLTYDAEHMPVGGSISKRELQLFMKRLRNEKGSGIRFFGCGEYGEKTYRAHYHAILFNCHFADQVQFSKNARGEPVYTSGELARIWGLGHCTVGAVTFDSAAYVARYTLKKLSGKLSCYEYVDINGEVHAMEPPFALMSRRPGIGREYYERYGAEIRDHDNVVINGHVVAPPRYYSNITKEHFPDVYERQRRKRKEGGVLAKPDNTVDRRRTKEVLALQKQKRFSKSKVF